MKLQWPHEEYSEVWLINSWRIIDLPKSGCCISTIWWALLGSCRCLYSSSDPLTQRSNVMFNGYLAFFTSPESRVFINVSLVIFFFCLFNLTKYSVVTGKLFNSSKTIQVTKIVDDKNSEMCKQNDPERTVTNRQYIIKGLEFFAGLHISNGGSSTDDTLVEFILLQPCHLSPPLHMQTCTPLDNPWEKHNCEHATPHYQNDKYFWFDSSKNIFWFVFIKINYKIITAGTNKIWYFDSC